MRLRHWFCLFFTFTSILQVNYRANNFPFIHRQFKWGRSKFHHLIRYCKKLREKVPDDPNSKEHSQSFDTSPEVFDDGSCIDDSFDSRLWPTFYWIFFVWISFIFVQVFGYAQQWIYNSLCFRFSSMVFSFFMFFSFFFYFILLFLFFFFFQSIAENLMKTNQI